MAMKLNPYLTFDGRAREAMTRYQQIFGGDLRMSTFGEFGMQGEGADGIMHAQLETPAGFTLMASDTAPGMPTERSAGGAFSISLSGDDEEALRGYWDALAEGGRVAMQLERQMWGDTFGMLNDAYGVHWMVDIAGESAGENSGESAGAGGEVPAAGAQDG